MKKYIAVDSGKFATKCAIYSKDENKTAKFMFHTRVAKGDFRDDSIENNTFLIELGGVCYKIGSGARGDGADLSSSKMSEIHKICTIAAIAQLVSATEIDEVACAVGLPAKIWENVDRREQYKSFMFPEGDIKVRIKMSSDSPILEKTFRFAEHFAFPESIGALFMPETPLGDINSTCGVLDIGNLNINATLWNGTELLGDDSISDELGGAILIQELAQTLSAEFSRCSESYVAGLLRLPPEERYLRPKNGDKEVEEKSKQIINEVLLDHARKIKRICDGRKWSLDYMNLCCMGGTATILADSLRQVFGDNLVILNNPAFCNALGYLAMLCSKTLNVDIVDTFEQ